MTAKRWRRGGGGGLGPSTSRSSRRRGSRIWTASPRRCSRALTTRWRTRLSGVGGREDGEEEGSRRWRGRNGRTVHVGNLGSGSGRDDDGRCGSELYHDGEYKGQIIIRLSIFNLYGSLYLDTISATPSWMWWRRCAHPQQGGRGIADPCAPAAADPCAALVWMWWRCCARARPARGILGPCAPAVTSGRVAFLDVVAALRIGGGDTNAAVLPSWR